LSRSIDAKTSMNSISDQHSETLKTYLLEALKASNANPPDSEYQRGYLGALVGLFEDLCMTPNERMQHRIIETAALHTKAHQPTLRGSTPPR
jgi:hypothetical protein